MSRYEGWVPSNRPYPRHEAARRALKASEAAVFVQEFLDSGDPCWSKEFEDSPGYRVHQEAENTAGQLSMVAQACPVKVSRRAGTVYIERR